MTYSWADIISFRVHGWNIRVSNSIIKRQKSEILRMINEDLPTLVLEVSVIFVFPSQLWCSFRATMTKMKAMLK